MNSQDFMVSKLIFKEMNDYQIVYEAFIDENNEIFSTGEADANLVPKGQSNQLYFYPNKNFFGHYDENGKILKSLNENSINGADCLLHLE